MIGWGCALSFSVLVAVITGITWLSMTELTPLNWWTMPITIIVFILVSWALAPRQHTVGK